ncbi:hypothetical protein B0O99DRAFT_183543 [Bisporella sp. PMI_857]|nr:hypothetical protein B0O99DRAFT_183543 [Bisporella sp. PMI_857]
MGRYAQARVPHHVQAQRIGGPQPLFHMDMTEFMGHIAAGRYGPALWAGDHLIVPTQRAQSTMGSCRWPNKQNIQDADH